MLFYNIEVNAIPMQRCVSLRESVTRVVSSQLFETMHVFFTREFL